MKGSLFSGSVAKAHLLKVTLSSESSVLPAAPTAGEVLTLAWPPGANGNPTSPKVLDCSLPPPYAMACFSAEPALLGNFEGEGRQGGECHFAQCHLGF